jgi:hypothetical protein
MNYTSGFNRRQHYFLQKLRDSTDLLDDVLETLRISNKSFDRWGRSERFRRSRDHYLDALGVRRELALEMAANKAAEELSAIIGDPAKSIDEGRLKLILGLISVARGSQRLRSGLHKAAVAVESAAKAKPGQQPVSIPPHPSLSPEAAESLRRALDQPEADGEESCSEKEDHDDEADYAG